jgi:hypothetical protein
MAKPKKAGKKAVKKTSTSTSTAERFERRAYELPVMDLGEAIALATALLTATPAKAAPAIAEEARRIAAARDRGRAVQKSTPAGSDSVEARSHDVAMDRAWTTFVRRVEDHVELARPGRADAADLATIYAIVRDLSILKLNYLAEFAQIGARLDALKREGLLAAACVLTGAEFYDEVVRCHGAYGEALGIGSPSAPATKAVDRGEARLALTEAIAEYAVQVMAQARAGRAESWAPVQKALRAIVDLRTRQEKTQRSHAPRPAPPAHPPL